MTRLLSPEIVRELSLRIDAGSLSEDDRALIKAVMVQHLAIGQALQDRTTTIAKLMRMLFGQRTEKARKVMPDPALRPKHAPPTSRGHGRNGAPAYARAAKIVAPHVLHSGDACPGCEKGKLYPSTPGVTIRITGTAPLAACLWEQEKLRCNCCGELFAATLPDGVGVEKHDASAGAMIALLKYGTGVPLNRLEALQESLGIPLPASTQWDVIEKTAGRIYPAYQELIRNAAQGELLHNDDTTMKLLAAAGDGERSGTFTTGVLSVTDEQKIALFFTGHKHAGENMADLLKKRHPDRGPPLQMCDALSRNEPKDVAVILANCLAHARRNFVDQAENFPDDCRHVIEALGEVYGNDAATKALKPPDRLAYHQTHSGPVMENLRAWMTAQFDAKTAEPNSGLGKAFTYMLKHWEALTLFLRVEGAPLDNNACERALKMAIRHRRNSLFYKTLHGAYIGDLFMSIIHTCRLSKVNPLDYLVALQKHHKALRAHPDRWMPWNYTRAATVPAS